MIPQRMDALAHYISGFAADCPPSVTAGDLASIYGKDQPQLSKAMNRCGLAPSTPGSGTIPHKYRPADVLPVLFQELGWVPRYMPAWPTPPAVNPRQSWSRRE